MAAPKPEDILKIATELDPDFAPFVSRWDIDVGEDWTGDPAVHVVVVLKDATIRAAWKIRVPYREELFETLLERVPGYFPYVGFSAESEAINPEEPVRV